MGQVEAGRRPLQRWMRRRGGWGGVIMRSSALLWLAFTFFVPFLILFRGSGSLWGVSSRDSSSGTGERRRLGEGDDWHSGEGGGGGGGKGERDKGREGGGREGGPALSLEELIEGILPCDFAGCPRVTEVRPRSGPTRGGFPLTITGSDFGAAGGLLWGGGAGSARSQAAEAGGVEVRVGPAACVSVEVVSATRLVCVAPAGIGAHLPVTVSVGNLTGGSSTWEALFSYEAPLVSRVEPNHGPRSGKTVLSLHGANFGVTESALVAYIGGVPCESTQWLSDGVVKCMAPTGAGLHLPVQIKACGCGRAVRWPQMSSGDTLAVFSYDEDTIEAMAQEVFEELSAEGSHVDLVMHKGLVNHEYEVTYSLREVGKEAASYAVPPELLSAIPSGDFSGHFRSCAVVGASGSLLDSDFGKAIDDHSAVFRVNNAVLRGYEDDAGTKTSFQFVGHFWVEEMMSSENGPHDSQWLVPDSNLVLWSMLSQPAYVQLRQMMPTSSIWFLSRQKVEQVEALAEKLSNRLEISRKRGEADAVETQSPEEGEDADVAHRDWSSLLYAVFFAQQVCKHVDIYGVDYKGGKYRYYSDYEADDAERDQASLEYLVLKVLEAGVNASREGRGRAAPPTRLATISVVEPEREPPQMMVAGDVAVGEVADEVARGEVADAVARGAVADALPQTTECVERPCKLHCSQRGVEHFGTCVCDPIYAGGDCSIDLLTLNADKLLEGVNLTYQGALTLHKGAAEGQGESMHIDLPEGITRDKLREGDVYKVDQRLYDVLPKDDFTERYGSCAIVGNSGAMLEEEHGRDIDAHDLVYRFNQGPTRKYESHVGTRTSLESLNGFWVKQLLDNRRGFRWNWRSRETGLLLFEMFEPWAFAWKSKTQLTDKDKWWREVYLKLHARYPERRIVALSPSFVAWAYQLYRNLRRRFQRARLGHYEGEKPMSGFYAFLFCMQVCDEIDLYGFQPFRDANSQSASGVGGLSAKYHYFDKATPRPGSHSFDLARYIYQLVALRNESIHIYD